MLPTSKFRIWYEYDVLGWPPTLLSKKYDVSISSICNYARKYRSKFEKYSVPDKWLCEPSWRLNKPNE